jgi:hypothetical protein
LRAEYSVIGYIPDPARGEALNVGIVAWNERGFVLRIDDQAVARVIRENPKLEKEALLYLEPTLYSAIAPSAPPFNEHRLMNFIEMQRGYPVLLSEPRSTTVEDGSERALVETADRLALRLVRPRRRSGGSAPNATQQLERQLKPLLRDNVVAKNHFFAESRTGVPRVVDFFANSGANVALDVLRLSIASADLIRVRSDAEAFKIMDVRERNNLSEYVVFCEFSETPESAQINANATRVLETSGARVVPSVEDAAEIIYQATGTARQPELFR